MYILIKYNIKNIYLSVSPSYNIEKIKDLINIKINNKYKKYNLYFLGKKLDNNKTLYDYNIENNSILNLNFDLKGGNNIILGIFFTLLLLIWIFLIFPLILCSGSLQFIGGIIEYIIYIVVSSLLKITGNIVKGKPINALSRTIVFLLKIFKISFYYLFLYTVFGLTFLFLNYILNIFKPDNEDERWCSKAGNVKLATTVLTIFYIVFYLIYEIPDGVLAGVTSLGGKNLFFNLFIKPILVGLRTILDGIKELLVFLNPLSYIFTPLILYIDTLIDVLTEFSNVVLGILLDIGCDIPNNNSNNNSSKIYNNKLKNSSKEKITDMFTKFKSLDELHKKRGEISKKNIFKYYLKNRNEQKIFDPKIDSKIDNNIDKIKIKKYDDKDLNCKYNILESEDFDSSSVVDNEKVNQIDFSNMECCTDDKLNFILDVIKLVCEQENIIQGLSPFGISKKVLEIAELGFDSDRIDQEVKDSGGFPPTKVLYAQAMRVIICNIFNLLKDGNNMFMSLGTPQRLGESMKAGVFAGFSIIIIYLIVILILIIAHFF